MPTSPRRIYWDSCVIIGVLQKDPEYSVMSHIIDLAERGELLVVVSELARIETLPQDVATRARIDEFYDQPFIEPAAADEPVVKLAQHIRDKNRRIDGFDVVLIATAIQMGCESFLTCDGDQKPPKTRKPPLSLGVIECEGKKVLIQTPREWWNAYEQEKYPLMAGRTP